MVGWFEIPVTDMDRAVKFYETVFNVTLERHPMGEFDMSWFPGYDEDIPGSPGSLVKYADYYSPSKEGVLIYFTSRSGDLTDELSRVETAGGTILQPKTQISEDIGYMGLILDTENNRIALHSPH